MKYIGVLAVSCMEALEVFTGLSEDVDIHCTQVLIEKD